MTTREHLRAALVAAVVVVTVLGTSGPVVGASLATDDASTECTGLTSVPSELDLGGANVGKTTTASWTFKNPTNATVSYSAQITGENAPAFGIVSGGAGTVPGGGCATITLSFTPSEEGDFDATLEVTASGGSESTALDGKGLEPEHPEASFGPESHDFGKVNVDESAKTEFVLRNSGEAPLAVGSVSISGSDAFSVSGGLPSELAPGQKATVTVTFSPSETGGASATISVGTNDSDAGPLTGSVTGEGTDTSLSISSASMSFGDVSVDDSETMSVTVTNDGSEAVTLGDVSVSGSGSEAFSVVSAPGTLEPGSSGDLTVRFEPPAEQSYGATITLSAGSDTGLGVSVSGEGTAPKIKVAPGSINFGKTVTSDVVQRDVQVINRGSEELEVTSLSILGSNAGAFSVDGAATPMTLAPGETRTLTVTFAPSEAKPHSASLVFNSNAEGGSSTVYLSNTQTSVEQESRSSGNATRSTIEVNDASEGQTFTFAFSDSGEGSALLYAGAASDVRVPENDVSLSTMNLTVAEGGDFSLGVASSQEQFDATPAFELKPRNGTEPVGYLNVTHTIADENIDEVEFTHRVSKQRLEELDADIEDYALYRYHDGEWVELDVTVVDQTDSYYVVKATSPGLSDFTSGVKQPKFRVVDTEVEVTKINIGEDVGVRVEIRNDGGADGTYTTRLLLDGEVVAQKDATIGPEGKRVVTFEQEITSAGTYTVEVNNVTIDDVEVAGSEVSDGTSGPGGSDATGTAGDQTGVPGFGPVVALVALLAAALLARRER
jgi:PGF-CTERM protein